MLILSYSHIANEHVALNTCILPTDPYNCKANLDDLGYQKEDIGDVRFYCKMTAHDRTMHFKTNNAAVKSMASDGTPTCSKASVWKDDTPLLSGHTTYLPFSADLAGEQSTCLHLFSLLFTKYLSLGSLAQCSL